MAGVITISIELELGWGVHQHGGLTALSDRRERETEVLSRLLSLCDRLDIEVTFDVVGHLLRDRPLEDYDGPHPDGWFDHVSAAHEPDPLFHAPDLVERIQTAKVDHEICTHTFSHIECSQVSEETLRWELEQVCEEHRKAGLDQPVSFVPPRHSIPAYNILGDYGIESVRVPVNRHPAMEMSQTKVRKFVEILWGEHPIVSPQMVDGLVESYVPERLSLATPLLPSGQRPSHPVFRTMPLGFRQRLHERTLEKVLNAVDKQGGYVHLWSHVWDLANEYQWPQVREFLESLAKRIRQGGITTATIKNLNNKVRGRPAE